MMMNDDKSFAGMVSTCCKEAKMLENVVDMQEKRIDLVDKGGTTQDA